MLDMDQCRIVEFTKFLKSSRKQENLTFFLAKDDISSIEDIATAAVDLESQSSFGNASGPTITNKVDMPISTVRKVMRKILRFYPYKIQRV